MKENNAQFYGLTEGFEGACGAEGEGMDAHLRIKLPPGVGRRYAYGPAACTDHSLRHPREERAWVSKARIH